MPMVKQPSAIRTSRETCVTPAQQEKENAYEENCSTSQRH